MLLIESVEKKWNNNDRMLIEGHVNIKLECRKHFSVAYIFFVYPEFENINIEISSRALIVKLTVARFTLVCVFVVSLSSLLIVVRIF